MNESRIEKAERRLASPRAAGVAGILFALLYGTALVLIRISRLDSQTSGGVWQIENPARINFALGLVPFAGIAFLWFIGVVRDRIGEHEDKLFATVFLGSGILYLAMMFVASALAGAMLASLAVNPQLINEPIYLFGQDMMSLITGIYSLRMAGVFMVSFASIFLRNRVLPVWINILTLVLAVFLLLSANLNAWLALAFPAWVFAISLYILMTNYRRQEGATTTPAAEA